VASRFTLWVEWTIIMRDITKRKRVEEALRESEDRFRNMADSAPVMIWMSGVDKLCTWFNRQWLTFVGRTMAQELGEGWTENVHPEDLDRCLRIYVTHFDAREPFSMEYRLRRHDGQWRWILDNGVPRYDSRKSFAGYIGSCVDVTSVKLLQEQQVLAERELRRRDQERAVLFDSSPDVVVRIDSNIRATHVNAAFEKMTGISYTEAVGKTGRQLPVPKEAVELADPLIRKVFETGQPGRTEWSHPVPGGVGDFEVSFIPEFAADGSVAAVFSIARDITEQRRAEQELRRREQELASLFDNCPDVIVRLDRDARALYMNSEWERLTGIEREKGRGKSIRELGLPKAVVDLQERVVRRVLKTGSPVTVDYSYPSPSGPVELEVRHNPEFSADGTLSSILLIGRDVSEQRRLQKLAEANARHIRDLSAGMITAQEQERRRVARDLHDSICQHLGALASELGSVAGEFPPSLRTGERLRAAQTLALRTANEARDLAHRLHPAILDDLGLETALQNLCEEFSERESIQARFRFRTGPHAVPQETASCVYRIAQEALHNVARHAQAKHVSVRLSVGRNVRLAIRDDGAGFDPGAVQGAPGLGLVSMKERARTAGGELSLRTRPGHGVSIELIVPSGGSAL
jgi:PAS domain S-box-containing protein